MLKPKSYKATNPVGLNHSCIWNKIVCLFSNIGSRFRYIQMFYSSEIVIQVQVYPKELDSYSAWFFS